MVKIASIIDQIREALRRPRKAQALQRLQTEVGEQDHDRAMLGSLKRELAQHPSRGLTPARLYALLEAAEQGDLVGQHALFADMEEKDAQIASDLGKRKLAAAELEWQIVPPDDATPAERRATDQALECFASLEVEDLIVDLADGLGHGWVNLALPWRMDGATRAVDQPIWTDHTWFQTPTAERDVLTLRDGSVDGEPLWPMGWLMHRHKAKSGYVSRLGLHRSLVWPYLFQAYALGDLAELLEILGIPARLGKYPRGASEDEKATLLNAVVTLGHSAAGIIPDGMAIEYLEAARADGATHQVMLNWCERSKSKVILGGTLTTGTDQGSGAYSLGEVHERGLASIIASDIRQYAATIRRDLLWPMAAINYGIASVDRSPRFFLDQGDTEDYRVLAETLPVFVDLGARVPRWWLHEKTRIPEAGANEEILQHQIPAAQPPAPPAAAAPPAAPATDAARAGHTCCDHRLDALAAERPQAPNDWTERLTDDLTPAVDAMLGQIRAMVRSAASLPELAEMLRQAYPDLDRTALRAALRDGIAAATLAGASDEA